MSIYNNNGVKTENAYSCNGTAQTTLYDSHNVRIPLDNSAVNYNIYSTSNYCECPIEYMQGFAIYDNLIFQFKASTSMGIDNLMCVIDANTGEMISRDIASTSGHGDSATFSNVFENPSDQFPLLYVTADETPCKVYVNNVTTISSNLVKTLKFSPDIVGYYAAHALDSDANVLYMLGYSENTFIENVPMILSKWDLATLTLNEDGTFTPRFISSLERPYIFVTQGQCYHDGMIWVASGYPSNYNSYIYAIDPTTGRTLHSYDLGTTEEVEGVDFISRNEMIVGIAGGKYTKFTFEMY